MFYPVTSSFIDFPWKVLYPVTLPPCVITWNISNTRAGFLFMWITITDLKTATIWPKLFPTCRRICQMHTWTCPLFFALLRLGIMFGQSLLGPNTPLSKTPEFGDTHPRISWISGGDFSTWFRSQLWLLPEIVWEPPGKDSRDSFLGSLGRVRICLETPPSGDCRGSPQRRRPPNHPTRSKPPGLFFFALKYLFLAFI